MLVLGQRSNRTQRKWNEKMQVRAESTTLPNVSLSASSPPAAMSTHILDWLSRGSPFSMLYAISKRKIYSCLILFYWEYSWWGKRRRLTRAILANKGQTLPGHRSDTAWHASVKGDRDLTEKQVCTTERHLVFLGLALRWMHMLCVHWQRKALIRHSNNMNPIEHGDKIELHHYYV